MKIFIMKSLKYVIPFSILDSYFDWNKIKYNYKNEHDISFFSVLFHHYMHSLRWVFGKNQLLITSANRCKISKNNDRSTSAKSITVSASYDQQLTASTFVVIFFVENLMAPRKIKNNHQVKINYFQCSESQAKAVGQSYFTIHWKNVFSSYWLCWEKSYRNGAETNSWRTDADWWNTIFRGFIQFTTDC